MEGMGFPWRDHRLIRLTTVVVAIVVTIVIAAIWLPVSSLTSGSTPNSDRIRSGTQLRGLAQAVTMYTELHGTAPSSPDWATLLLRENFITPEMLKPPGSVFGVPYHYIRPSSVADVETDSSKIIVFYEDPVVWAGAGGTVVYMDATIEWIPGDAYRLLVERLRTGTEP